jgi:hypothetical protein
MREYAHTQHARILLKRTAPQSQKLKSLVIDPIIDSTPCMPYMSEFVCMLYQGRVLAEYVSEFVCVLYLGRALLLTALT